MDFAGTFKYSKTDLVNQGFNPVAGRSISPLTTCNREHSSASIRNSLTAFKRAAFAFGSLVACFLGGEATNLHR